MLLYVKNTVTLFKIESESNYFWVLASSDFKNPFVHFGII